MVETRELLKFDMPAPVQLSDVWQVSTPHAEIFSSLQLESIYRDLHEGHLRQLRSLLVLRHGKLLAESDFKDPGNRTRPQAIWSCTKQFVGVLVGIAVDEALLSPSDPLSVCIDKIPTKYPDKQEVLIEKLLEIQSGIAHSNDGASGHTSQMLRELPHDSLDFILSLPNDEAPGTKSAYKDGDPHLVSHSLQRLTGETMDAWGDKVLFKKLNLNHYERERYGDGVTVGVWGLLTTP